jgi:hypothetical protein
MGDSYEVVASGAKEADLGMNELYLFTLRKLIELDRLAFGDVE